MSDTDMMRTFLRVVEEGSFSAAARFLGISASSASRQIADLEEDLGARLFNRTTRQQSLTEAGQLFFHHASRIVADIDEARACISQLTQAPSGTLRVTTEPDFAMAFIAPLLPIFFEKHPDIQVQLMMDTGTIDIVSDAIDLAIRFGHLTNSDLIARKLAISESVVCASPKYLSRYGIPQSPEQLEAHNCLSFRVGHQTNRWHFGEAGHVTSVPVSGSLSANSLTYLRESALSGIGMVMIPRWMVSQHLQEGSLQPVLQNYPIYPKGTPIQAVFAHKRFIAPKIRVFVEFLAAHLARQAMG